MGAAMRYQPQGAGRLNAGNALTRGLVHAWSTNAGLANGIVDLAGKADGVFGSGTSGNPSGNKWLLGPDGYYVAFNDAGTGTVNSVFVKVGDANGSGSPGSQTFSLAFRARIGALGSGQAIYGAGSAGGVEVQIDSAGKITLVKQQTASLGASTGSITAGVDVSIGISYDGATVNYYINGAPAGSSSSAQSFVLAAQYYLGAAGSTGERLPNGSRIYSACVWNRVLSAAELRSWGANPWQIFDDTARAATFIAAASGTSATAGTALAGPAIASASGSGSLSTAIKLTGVANAQVTCTGILATAIPLASNISAASSSAAQLQTAIAVTGNSNANATGAASLTSAISLAGAASSIASASAAIATQIRLSANASAQATLSATLTTTNTLAGSASAAANSSAALATAIVLAGSAAGVASSSAALATGSAISALAAAQASSSAALTTTIALASAAIAQAQASASLSAQPSALSGGALARAAVSAALSTQIALVAIAYAQVQATATLSSQTAGQLPDVTIDASLIPTGRWIAFEGTGRVVTFEGNSRVVAFEGNNRTVSY
jgi:hypothetical protein